MVKKRLILDMCNEIDKALKCIKDNQSFLLSGGAGSGKTHSMVTILQRVFENDPNTSIACITYTNAAAKEILSRIKHPNLRVSTIHEFLWDIISPFQKELKELIKNKINGHDLPPEIEIQYKEYSLISKGIISHDHVICLSEEMFRKYLKLRKIVGSCYRCIFVDEYQDTFEDVIKILLEYLQDSIKKPIIGLFGDSMQSIYENRVENLNSYIGSGKVVEITKKENYRNPKSVIELANKIRSDGLQQEHSNENNAPNMRNGQVKEGNITFLYSRRKELDIDIIRESEYCKHWDFANSKVTRELRLTHNLIANENDYKTLYNIYDKDPFEKIISELKEKETFENHLMFKELLDHCKDEKLINKLGDLVKNPDYKELYDFLKDKPWKEVQKTYFRKEYLIDGKRETQDDEEDKQIERDPLIKHLFKVQYLVDCYENKDFLSFNKKVEFRIERKADKSKLKKIMDKLSCGDYTIQEVVDLADNENICKKDDYFNKYVNDQKYLYFRVGAVKYREFRNLYRYLGGQFVLSTQHKIKGLEFDNVLLLLDNGGWRYYNFSLLFNKNVTEQESVLKRTQKLFYVCITRTKESLVVYYPEPDDKIISQAEYYFGADNVKLIGDRQ